jgi:hypothetical protein
MFTTLGYEAQKAVIEERLRRAAIRQQLPRGSGSRPFRHPASVRGRARRPLGVIVTLRALLRATGKLAAALHATTRRLAHRAVGSAISRHPLRGVSR